MVPQLPHHHLHSAAPQRLSSPYHSESLLPNVHVAHHPTITPEHLHDHSHLRKQTVGMFAKSLKDMALGRQTTHAALDRGQPRDPYQTIAPPRSPRPIQQSQRTPQAPPTTSIGLVRQDRAQPTTPHQTTTPTRPERKPHGPDLALLHSTGPNSRTSAA